MNSLITPSNITFTLGILMAIFGVYSYFRNPQIRTERRESIFSLKIDSLEKELINLKDNHLHTMDLKIDTANANINALNIQVARLSTIIEERIPKR